MKTNVISNVAYDVKLYPLYGTSLSADLINLKSKAFTG